MLTRICSLLKIQPSSAVESGLLLAHGPTVPTDGAKGYQTGCLFQHTDGGLDTALYVNEGTVAACDFNPVTVVN